MRFIAIFTVVFSLAMVSNHAYAQSDDGGVFGGLFNKNSQPLFINRGNGNPNVGSTSGRASQTGVATSPNRGNANNPLNYRVISNKPESEMSVGELIQQSSAEQSARTDAFAVQKQKEAAEMAELYRQQMRERLAAQSNDPSALQSMGGGGTGGVNSEQIKRRMIYQQEDDTPGGKKPIRLFNVR